MEGQQLGPLGILRIILELNLREVTHIGQG